MLPGNAIICTTGPIALVQTLCFPLCTVVTVAGPAAAAYVSGLDHSAEETRSSLFESYRKKEEEYDSFIRSMHGTENPYILHREMGELMTKNVTVVRNNKDLAATDVELQNFMERWSHINMIDNGFYSNQVVMFTKQLKNMMELARVITIGALNRNESRGSHYKPEFPDRNDTDFLKTTKAFWTKEGPRFEWEDVDISHIQPVARTYGK